MTKIKIALIGVGNNCSSLLQGIHFHKQKRSDIGILHPKIGKYRIQDIEVVAAYDVNQDKVGMDLSTAIFSHTNCSSNLCNVPEFGIEVKKGPVLDGVGRNLVDAIPINERQCPVNISETLKESNAEIVINFLPTGSKEATKFYAQESLKAHCGFINAIPELIASTPKWNKKFSKAGLPLAGDDIKSQIGGTIVHRAIVNLFVKRGVKIEETCQTNSAGNSDYLNLSDEVRYNSKLVTKKSSIQSLLPYDTNICMPTPEYIKNSEDHRSCHITVKGKYFGETPVSVDVKLNIEDSPNAAGSVIDVIRLMRLAIDRNLSGTLDDICPFYFKYYPKPCDDYQAYEKVKKFIDS